MLIVKFKPGADREGVEKCCKEHNFSLVGSVADPHTYEAFRQDRRLCEGREELRALAERISAESGVESVDISKPAVPY